ncbi:MAG: S41 family peptidase [Eubacteriales bacterium]|nr:S41 family peptidase [Eubacteriales bacterium]
MDRNFYKGLLAGALGTLLIIGAGWFGYHQALYGQSTVLSDTEHVSKLVGLEKMIDEYYLNEKDEDMLAEGMYAGLIAGLNDVYSRYYTAEQYKVENQTTEGSYVGIGILMEKNADGGVRVYSCYENSPAQKAGLLEGDIITKVNGEDITNAELTEVSERIKVDTASSVTLTVYRKGIEESMDIVIEIDNVEMPSVSHDLIGQHVGYIKIDEFTKVTYDQFMSAYAELKGRGMESLVIDLRNNPGGLMDSVCAVLRELLPEGLIVYTENKNGEREEITCDGENRIEIPLAVLVNHNSASAAEIFAGAVQDHGIGTIIGTSTYGKGVVQSLFSLKDGSAVKLTVSNYYTPNGHSINKVGISPDVEIELEEKLLNKETFTYEEDNQLQKALEILKK